MLIERIEGIARSVDIDQPDIDATRRHGMLLPVSLAAFRRTHIRALRRCRSPPLLGHGHTRPKKILARLKFGDGREDLLAQIAL